MTDTVSDALQSQWQMATTTKQVAEVCRLAREAGAFSLDVEFRRERTYHARVDLIQLAIDGQTTIVDPIAGADPMEIWELVADDAVEVVVHSGRQDLEIAFDQTSKPPTRIFDTQIAAAMVGFGDQIAYDRLLESVVGIRVNKLETTSDWSRRPLSDRQVSYAIDDVRYLPQLRVSLGAMLERASRTEWAMEEMGYLSLPETYRPPLDELWRGVSGTQKLRSRAELAALRALTAWRELEARTRDLPRKWVVPDDVLVDVARRRPRVLDDIQSLGRLSEKVLVRHGAAMVEAVKEALDTPEDTWPIRTSTDDSAAVSALADLLDLYLRVRARDAGVAAPRMGNKKDVLAVARYLLDGKGASAANGKLDAALDGDPEVPLLLRGWRRDVIGEELVSVATGEASLRFDPKSKVVTTGRNPKSGAE